MKAKEVLGRELRPGESWVSAVSATLNQEEISIIGTCAAVSQEKTQKAIWFCKIRNFLLRKGLIKGFNGIFFTNRKLFEMIGGYDENRDTFEHIDLIKRALASGARWVFLEDVYVELSMRRYETSGYLKTLFWWLIEAIRYKLGLHSRKWVPSSSLEKK